MEAGVFDAALGLLHRANAQAELNLAVVVRAVPLHGEAGYRPG